MNEEEARALVERTRSLLTKVAKAAREMEAAIDKQMLKVPARDTDGSGGLPGDGGRGAGVPRPSRR